MVFERVLSAIFDMKSRRYDQFKEDYPNKLFKDILKFSSLKKGKPILEIGCGTGYATLPLARMGLNVTGLDISKRMIEQAELRTEGYSNIDYIVGSFEETRFPSKSFDMIAAAQSWHWFKPTVAYKKAHSLLKDKGVLALFWKFQDERSPLVSAVRELYAKHCPNFPSDFGSTSSTESRLSECELFETAVRVEYRKQKPISKSNFITLTKVYSWADDLHKSGKDQDFLSELSDVIEPEDETISVPYRYVLLLTRKK